MLKWLKALFTQENKPLVIAKSGSGFPSGRIQLNEKTLQKLSERINGFNDKIQQLQRMIEEFQRQQERMDDLAQKIIGIVAHECTLDSKYTELEKKVREIETIVAPPQERRKNEKQAIFEL